MNAAALLLLLLLCAALAHGQKRPPKVTKKPTPKTTTHEESSFESVATSQVVSIGEETKHATNDASTMSASLASKTQEEATTAVEPAPVKEDKLFPDSNPTRHNPSRTTTTDIFGDEFAKEKCSGIQCFDAITLIIIIVAVIIGIFLVIISFVVGRKCCRGSSTQAKYSKIGEMYN